MLEFLSSISTGITTLLSFLGAQVANFFALLQMFALGSSFLVTCIAFLPPAIVAFGTITITISIVFLIVGR